MNGGEAEKPPHSLKGGFMKYIYTATFTPAEDGSSFYCRVPDLPGCISSGKDLADAITMITDAAAGWLCVAEDEGLEITPPTPQNRIPHNPDDVLSFIQIDTIQHRAANDNHSVRKNVSLPAWMSALADKRRINCSQVLQEGLMKILESV